MQNETYLGDGLYASFDGYSITLRAPREFGNHIVVLEPQVYEALLRFVVDINASRIRDAQPGLQVAGSLLQVDIKKETT